MDFLKTSNVCHQTHLLFQLVSQIRSTCAFIVVESNDNTIKCDW